MNRYFFRSSILDFRTLPSDTILGRLAKENPFDLTDLQRNTWLYEFELLKQVLSQYNNGEIIFEFSIPRLGKRIDVVLLLKGIIFVLEFKVGATEYGLQDIEQTWDYALDLKNFHEPSRNLYIAPILVATHAQNCVIHLRTCNYDGMVYEPLRANEHTLTEVINTICRDTPPQTASLTDWSIGRYSPTPTIIQAASALYAKHNVADITRCDAGENLQATTDFILRVIEDAKQNNQKSICFVTGVPGAGKTLVGLNVAMKQFEKKELAVYLSGNAPLVDVLSEALARDNLHQEREKGNKYTLTEARKKVKSFIQIIHHYRDNTLAKLKLPIQNGTLEIDPSKQKKDKKDEYAEVDHVAIFDEAQRLWDKQNLAGWLARKKGIKDFPMSESEFLIWSMDLHPDWAVVVCLVGGGQEINTGEAGIAEPIRAANEAFPHWNVFISPQLTAKEYAGGKVNQLLEKNPNVTMDTLLHLATSMRSFRAEKLSTFVGQLLDRDATAAKETYQSFCNNYPILLTRNLQAAKKWLQKTAGGSERYGMICSSQAFRLRPLAIDVRAKPDIKHWFLDDITDIRSSLFLEDVATEFDIQGLELDYSCLIWDGDFQYTPCTWIQRDFKGGKWQNINAPDRKAFQLNAYRVLLTRARKGMIICIPEGSHETPQDLTRLPAFYDGTFEYLKSLGLQVIE